MSVLRPVRIASSGSCAKFSVKKPCNDCPSSDVTLTDNFTGLDATMRSLIVDGAGPDLVIKSLRVGDNMVLTETDGVIEISSIGGGPGDIVLNTAGVAVDHETLVNDGSGPVIAVKGLVGGTGIDLSSNDTDITITATGEEVTLQNAGIAVGNQTLVNDGTGPTLQTKALVAGDGITLTSDATDITISSTGSEVTLENAGIVVGGETLVNDGTGPDLQTKALVAGDGIVLTSDATDIIITATGTEVTLTSAGAELSSQSLVNDGTGPSLAVKGLVPGDNITFLPNANDIIISSTSGDVTLQNAGVAVGGETLVNDGTGPDLQTKAIVGGDGITLTSDATDITIVNDLFFSNTEVQAFSPASVGMDTPGEILDTWATVLDPGSNFTAASGVYTVPSTGRYEITATINYRTNSSINSVGTTVTNGTPEDFPYFSVRNLALSTNYTAGYIPALMLDTITINVDGVATPIQGSFPMSTGNVPLHAYVDLTAGTQIVVHCISNPTIMAPFTNITLNLLEAGFAIRRIL